MYAVAGATGRTGGAVTDLLALGESRPTKLDAILRNLVKTPAPRVPS